MMQGRLWLALHQFFWQKNDVHHRDREDIGFTTEAERRKKRIHHRDTEFTEKNEKERGRAKWRFVQIAKMRAT